MPISSKITLFTPALLLAAGIVLAGCSKPAVILTSKHDLGMASKERLTVLGKSGSSSIDKETLCGGDLNKILGSTSLDPAQQQKLTSYICGGQDSVKALHDFYFSLPDSSRIELKKAFELYGYELQGFG
ncbi:MAG: hypothetical protein M0022_00195 [Desulfobacteraceae bacterium]|nr:hypothetical protein [Desulfobacteraceae bacterium]